MNRYICHQEPREYSVVSLFSVSKTFKSKTEEKKLMQYLKDVTQNRRPADISHESKYHTSNQAMQRREKNVKRKSAL